MLATLEQVYAQLGEMTRRLDVVHAGRLQCRQGCSSCCVDEITVFEVEAENIRRHCADMLAGGTPHPPGGCAFLDEQGACRIYDHRPYVCRTQGYPLRWIEQRDDGSTFELRDICPLNETDDPIEGIGAEDCWTIGPFEEFLAQMQASLGEPQKRVRLRSLFDHETGTSDDP